MSAAPMTAEELAKAKTEAIRWLRDQDWICDQIKPVLEKEIGKIKKYSSSASKTTLYRNIRTESKLLSWWVFYGGGELPVDLDKRQLEVMCLVGQMVMLVAMSDDHNLQTVVPKHPFIGFVSGSPSITWWEDLCAELTNLISGKTKGKFPLTSIILSKHVTKATKSQHEANNKKLAELLQYWDKAYKRQRFNPAKPATAPSLLSILSAKSDANTSDANTSDASTPTKKREHKSAKSSDDENHTASAYKQMLKERNDAIAEVNNLNAQMNVAKDKYIKYKTMATELNRLLEGLHDGWSDVMATSEGD